MVFELLLLLMLLGGGASYLAFVAKKAPVYTSMANLGLWLLVAYGATSIDFIQDNGQLETAVAAEPALAVIAFGNAMLSGLVLIAAATGNYGDSEAPDPRSIHQ